MKDLIGANAVNITKIRQSDVFIGENSKVVGTVNIPTSLAEGEALKIGTLLHTADGGLTWNVKPADFNASANTDQEVYFKGKVFKSTADGNTNSPDSLTEWEDLGKWNANGVLFNDITSTQKTTVVVTGSVKQKYLSGFDEFLRATLFDNKLFAK